MGTGFRYPVGVKVTEMRLLVVTVKMRLLRLNIRNDTQLKTWMAWYKSEEIHGFRQPVWKQYYYSVTQSNHAGQP